MAATVIARDAIDLFQTVTIDKGASSGLRKDMAVISPAGVVGRVVEQPPLYAAKVQLLIDREAGAGAIIERSGVGGVVVGQDREGEPPLELQFVSNLSDAKVGDRLVTSGLDGIFPRGITIGTLSKVEKGVGLYKRIAVTPAVDFAEVGAVLVVLDPPQTTGPRRRADRPRPAGRPSPGDAGGAPRHATGAPGHAARRPAGRRRRRPAGRTARGAAPGAAAPAPARPTPRRPSRRRRRRRRRRQVAGAAPPTPETEPAPSPQPPGRRR